jgi:tape measure domain-containing protein
MSGVDNRVVSITFDNAQFERKIAETIKSIESLKKSMNFDEAAKGVDGLSAATSHFDLSNMAKGIESIAGKFTALGAIGFTIIQSLTREFLNLAKSVAGKVWDPLVEGGKKRALNIEQAQFQFRGLGIDVTKAMDSSLKAVKGTAYGLDEAAKAASQFAASGIDVGDKMTGALRGVAGAAAMTGSSFSDIAQIFTQSAASGKVNTMDLQQFASRGLNVAAALGKVMGKTEQQVREMASSGKLDFKTFADAMDQAFGAHAQQANETFIGALANMKAALARTGAAFFGPTLEQQRDLLNTLSPIIDNVTAALKPLINALTGMGRILTNLAISKLFRVGDLKNFSTAMTNIAAGILNLFQRVFEVLKPIKEAFRDIFPKSQSSGLVAFSESFKKFTENLKIGASTASKIKSVFEGVFSIFRIGWEVVKGIADVFGALFGELSRLSGAFGDAAGGTGNFLTHLNDILVKGKGIQHFFEGLADAVHWVGDAIGKVFTHGIPGAKEVGDVADRIGQRWKELGGIWDWLADKLGAVGKVLATVGKAIGKFAKELGQKIADLFTPGSFKLALDAINTGLLGGIVLLFRNFLKNGLNIDLTGGMMTSVKGMFDELTGTIKTFQTQIKANALMKIAQAIAVLTAAVLVLSLIDSAALTRSMGALAVGMGELVGSLALLDKIATNQTAVKLAGLSAGLILLATAVVILSGAVAILASLSWGDLAKGLLGLSAILLIVIGASKVLGENTVGMIKAGIGMIGMSIGILLLSKAVEAFSGMNLAQLATGFISVAVGMALISASTNLMPKDMISKGLGLIAIAVGMKILASAVQAFAGLSWASLAKGFAAVAVGLVIIGAAMYLFPPDMIATSVGLIIVAAALNIMARAVATLGQMKMGDLAKGVGAIAAMLLVLAVATNAMTGAIAGAIALGIVAGALLGLAVVVKMFSGMKVGDMAKGMLAMAVAIAVLAGMAALITPLIPALLAMGAALTLVGAGFMLFGAGAYLVAKAFEALAKAGEKGTTALINSLTALATMLPKLMASFGEGVLAMGEVLLKGLTKLVPILGTLLGKLIDELSKLAPKLGDLLVKVVETALKALVRLYPEIALAGVQIILALLRGIEENLPKIVESAKNIIVNFLNGLANAIPQIIGAAVNLITSFINAIASNMSLIIQAGVNLIISFLMGIASAETQIIQAVTNIITMFITQIAASATQIAQAGTDALVAFLGGLTSDVTKVVDAVATLITTFITEVGKKATEVAQAGTDALVNFLNGVTNDTKKISDAATKLLLTLLSEASKNASKLGAAGATALAEFIKGVGKDIGKIVDAGTNLIISFIRGIGANALKIANAAMDTVVQFVNGLSVAIKNHSKELQEAGKSLAFAIADGMTGGMASKVKEAAEGAVNLAKSAWNAAMNFIKAASPSKLFYEMGQYMAMGMANALNDDTSAADSAAGLASRTVSAFQDSMSLVPDALANMDEFNPVITPVLDLTKVQADAKDLSRMVTLAPMAADLSFQQAQQLAHTTDTKPGEAEAPLPPQPTEVKFEQNIYAPEALSTNDIYRNTRSQIALAKEELSIP